MDNTSKVVPKLSQLQKAVFVSNHCYIGSGGGGVQWCTCEFLSSIKAAGWIPEIVATVPPRDILSRITRRLLPRPYKGLHRRDVLAEILQKVDRATSGWIFLNNTESAALAPQLRLHRPDVRLCFLSHGVEVTDVVNNLRLTPLATPPAQRKSRWLGDLLKTENCMRNALDAVVCISEQDVAFEHWLGSKSVLFLPRQVNLAPLELSPIKMRVGTVGTLSHGPNLHGLRLFAEALQDLDGIELRVVGGPESIGVALQNEFKSIRYLGELPDEKLRAEAATWCAFINPIFCYARGASTKVATALGWGLPVITTPHGARGYRWDQQALPLAKSVSEMLNITKQIASSDDAESWRMRAKLVANLAPTASEAGEFLLNFLESVAPAR